MFPFSQKLISTTLVCMTLSFLAILNPSMLNAQETDSASQEVRGCYLLSKNLKGGFEDKKIQSLFDSLNKALKKKSPKKLRVLFHPRLQKIYDTKKIRGFFTRFDLRYGKNFHISHYRTWQIDTPEGNPLPLTCQGGDFEIFPAYGYQKQALMWFNLLGDRELGKLAFQAVQRDGEWILAGMHIQQWTLKGKSSEEYFEDSQKFQTKNNPLAAYIYMDIAAKLLEGNPPIQFSMKHKLREQSDTLKSQETITPYLIANNLSAIENEALDAINEFHRAKPKDQAAAKKLFLEIQSKPDAPEWIVEFNLEDQKATQEQLKKKGKIARVEKVESYFTKYGPSILAHVRFHTELERSQRESECLSIARSIYQQILDQTPYSGIRCQFYYPRHELGKATKLRGIFIRDKKIRGEKTADKKPADKDSKQ